MENTLNIQIVRDEVSGTLGPTPLPAGIPLQLSIIQVIIHAAKAGWHLTKVEPLNPALETYKLVFEEGNPAEIEVIIAECVGQKATSWKHSRYPDSHVYHADLMELDCVANGKYSGNRWKEVGSISMLMGGKKTFYVAHLSL